MNQTKSFPISKQQVWEAWKRVKANQGGAGVDHQTLADFERDIGNHLYKIWNRMASGSYMPSPVKRVDIPKGDGKTRPLGIPTVADRVAQMVVKQAVEPEWDRYFHPDSYGYRPGKSAHQALGQARKRCWRNDWVLDVDIKGFFDAIDHELMMRAVKRRTQQSWVLLYIKRWLTAPVEMPDGTREKRSRGTPQGGVISPLLANLFLHYAFDEWMRRNHPSIPFERYADDVVCPSRTKRQTEHLRAALERRFRECGLTLHPEKTKIVYCSDRNRKRKDHPCTSFDFLGYTFRARKVKTRSGEFFSGFNPAVSTKATVRIRREIRSWGLLNRSDLSLGRLAEMCNAKIRGWAQYYGAYYKSALHPTLRYIDRKLVRWAMHKYKKLRRRRRRAEAWLRRIKRRAPALFAHWPLLKGVRIGRAE